MHVSSLWRSIKARDKMPSEAHPRALAQSTTQRQRGRVGRSCTDGCLSTVEKIHVCLGAHAGRAAKRTRRNQGRGDVEKWARYLEPPGGKDPRAGKRRGNTEFLREQLSWTVGESRKGFVTRLAGTTLKINLVYLWFLTAYCVSGCVRVFVGAIEVTLCEFTLCNWVRYAIKFVYLQSHPEVIKAAQQSLQEYGAGLSSVRFICGTQVCSDEEYIRIR